MDSKICVVCNIAKSIDNYYNKYRECKQCNIQRSMKRYRENKDIRSTDYKELHRSYVELQNKLKALEEKVQKEN